jgi:hypothetical protein
MGISCAIPAERFTRCIVASKRVRCDVETDVIRGCRRDHATELKVGKSRQMSEPERPLPRARKHFGRYCGGRHNG